MLSLQKDELRQQARLTLEAVFSNKQNFYERQNFVIDQIENSKIFEKAQVIMLYYSLPGEFDLSSLIISNPHKIWLLPRPIGKGYMLAFQVKELHDLLDLRGGLKVPKATNKFFRPENIDLLIAPGFAFDKNNYRLGRGGGYYDRYLSRLSSKARTIGLCLKELFVEILPHDENDFKFSEVLCA